MLVNHQVKTWLLPIPWDRFEDGRTFAAAANDFNSLEHFLTRRTRNHR